MTASALMNNAAMSTAESFPSLTCLSPRISFSRDFIDKPGTDSTGKDFLDFDSTGKDFLDFEFHLHEPVAMLPADELFSHGKLVPLQLSSPAPPVIPSPAVIGSVPSPCAPRCSRWRDLLGLRRRKTISNPKSFIEFRESDSEHLLISRRSLSSSSSSSTADHDDLPRLSLDSEKTGQTQGATMRRVRMVESPRMNASGRVVFQELERSSSSPGSFNGGRPRGMDRYSANVRVTPVINMPVGSMRGGAKTGSVFGFGQLFSPQRKERDGGARRCGGAERAHREIR